MGVCTGMRRGCKDMARVHSPCKKRRSRRCPQDRRTVAGSLFAALPVPLMSWICKGIKFLAIKI